MKKTKKHSEKRWAALLNHGGRVLFVRDEHQRATWATRREARRTKLFIWGDRPGVRIVRVEIREL